MNDNERICPVEIAGSLDGKIRKLMHNPVKILKPHVQEGMRVLDMGCGPGYFTLPMANLVGPTGQVCAVDLQQGMLDIVQRKILATPWRDRVVMHCCTQNALDLDSVLFERILLFWMLHEVPDQLRLLKELYNVLQVGGYILLVEPYGHVGAKKFAQELAYAQQVGFAVERCAAPFFSRAAQLRRS